MDYDFVQKLEEELLKNNICIKNSINFHSQEIQRFKNLNKLKSNKDIFLILHGNKGASFGNWNDQNNFKTWWYKDQKSLTTQEHKNYQAALKLRKQQILLNQAKAIWEVNLLFYGKEINENINHEYIKKKCIVPYYARQSSSSLLIPIHSIQHKLVSLQIISESGFKSFKKGAPIKSNMVWLSEILEDTYDGIIRICEGYATGCTIYETVGPPVFCALSAHNLLTVSDLINKKWPDSEIHICADNDCYGQENIGLNYALKAASKINAKITIPNFNLLDISTKPTDFNDLHILSGSLDIVYEQLHQLKGFNDE